MHRLNRLSPETAAEDEDVRSFHTSSKLAGWNARGQLKLRVPGQQQPTYLGTFSSEEDARKAARLFLRTVLDKKSSEDDIQHVISECKRLGGVDAALADASTKASQTRRDPCQNVHSHFCFALPIPLPWFL